MTELETINEIQKLLTVYNFTQNEKVNYGMMLEEVQTIKNRLKRIDTLNSIYKLCKMQAEQKGLL